MPDVSCNQREIVRDNLISVDRKDSRSTTNISRDKHTTNNTFADTASTGPRVRSFTDSGNGLRTEKATGGVLASSGGPTAIISDHDTNANAAQSPDSTQCMSESAEALSAAAVSAVDQFLVSACVVPVDRDFQVSTSLTAN